MWDTKIDFIIYDKQGPLSNAIRHSMKNTPVNIYRHKRISSILKFMQLEPKIDLLFLLFVFNEEFELVDCIELSKFDIPIIFAPTNKACYNRLSAIKGIKVMDVSRSKQEYVAQIKTFFRNLTI